MPMLTPTEKDQRCLVGAGRVSVSRSEHGVLVCVGDQENSEKTEVGACRRALDL